MTTDATSTASAERDRIQPVPPGVEGWSENLCLICLDSRAGIAVWCHLSRMPQAPSIWEGVIAVHLPDGRLLVSRSFGRSESEKLASSGALTARCVAPGESWRVGFEGMVRSTTSAAMAAGPLADGEVEPLQVDLDFAGLHPPWSPHGELTDQEWAHGHLEQGQAVTGTVRAGAETYALDTTGFRDHSYGPRDFSKLLGNTWCTGAFPSGRAFAALIVWQTEGPSFVRGFAWDGEALSTAASVELPRLAGRDGSPRRADVVLHTDRGAVEIGVEGRLEPMSWTWGYPVGLVPGALSDGRDGAIMCELPARLRWDGEEADGWIEKSLRPSRLEGG